MSKINELIKELCPNGVVYKKLGEVCKIEKGKQLNKEQLSDDGLYPVMNGGITPSGYWNEYNFDEDKITISQGGASAGYINYLTSKFWAGAHCYVVNESCAEVEYKYIYHFLKEKQKYLLSSQVGAGIPSISLKEINSLKIPLPPLAVQEEIVRILDKFGELEAELEAELEVRKSQYEFYHDKLFEFRTQFIEKSLEEVCDIVDYRGKTPKKVAYGIILVTAKNIKKGFIDYDISKEYIEKELLDDVMKRGKVKIGDVLFTTEAPCGHVAQVDRVDIALAQRVIKYSSKDSKILNNTYLKYFLLSKKFRKKLDRFSNGSTVKGIKGSVLHKLKIVIPSLEEQNKIVSILSKFDKLISLSSEGLPAEINLRRQQYAYYRNKLLDFEEFNL